MDVLKVLLSRSNWDDILSLLESKPKIIISLLTVIDENIGLCNYSQKEENSIKMAVYTLGLIIDTYDTVIIRCIKEGVGYIVGRLISSNNGEEVFAGLSLLRFLFQVSSN